MALDSSWCYCLRHLQPTLVVDLPPVCAHEWLGAPAGCLSTKLVTHLVTDFQPPVIVFCAKFSILLKIMDHVNLDHTTEDLRTIDDEQEAFRRSRSTNCQTAKLHSILHYQQKVKSSLSVILYLDIKNAFNAVNCLVIFFIF